MSLATVYWIFCIAFVVATLVMTASLVSIVTTTVEQIQRISERRARNQGVE